MHTRGLNHAMTGTHSAALACLATRCINIYSTMLPCYCIVRLHRIAALGQDLKAQLHLSLRTPPPGSTGTTIVSALWQVQCESAPALLVPGLSPGPEPFPSILVCVQLPVNACKPPINMLPPEGMAPKGRGKKKHRRRR